MAFDQHNDAQFVFKLQAFVRFFVLRTATTAVVCATARRAGRVRNVIFHCPNVNCHRAPAMDAALRVSAIVSAAGRASSAISPIAWTHPVSDTAHASMDSATARRAGKVMIAVLLINRCISVCQDARIMALTTLKLEVALVNVIGLVQTALKVQYFHAIYLLEIMFKAIS